MRYTNGHVIASKDRLRIRCECGRPAERCEYMRWTMCTRGAETGIAFYYFCDRCWITEGPNGTSPRDRASSS
jgi:hypothetical protein